MTKKILLGFSLVVSLLTMINKVYAVDGRAIRKVSFDEFEPRLHLENDTIYVVNFWATWCAPCVREIPVFETIQEQYKDQKVKVLLVSLDFPNQLESRVIPFVDRMGMKSEVVLLDDTDSNRWIPLVSEEWTGAIPATVIFARGFRGFYEQEFHLEELESIIKPLLN
ncbi:MAG: thioredoxin domain-containing protein [Bacteroidales bacterium]|jgi:thiol-disulfide isomerase/thioredoxin|nr:thioredoxin domain-containing protein [Bacteroidales bacterium]NLM93009.1 redoxin domain-containing protein [Bacteroidales bacterium]